MLTYASGDALRAYAFTVGVARARPLPPEPDEYRKIVVAAGSEPEAALIATQMAFCTCAQVLTVEPRRHRGA